MTDELDLNELEDGAYFEETYRKKLSREETLEGQIRQISYFYSRGMFKEFEYALRMLIALLPTDVKKEFPYLKLDYSNEGVEKHFQQFIDIQDYLENNTNMIWNKKFVKTFK